MTVILQQRKRPRLQLQNTQTLKQILKNLLPIILPLFDESENLGDEYNSSLCSCSMRVAQKC